jgi:phage I-like protein
MPIALHSLLPADGTAPDWVHLVPAGAFHGQDGRGPYRLAAPDAVIRASMAAGRIPIDENHATDLAAPSGGASPARGWIVEMQYRQPIDGIEPGGLYGRVEWTQSGAGLLADRAYRGISPVFQSSKDSDSGDVVRVLRAALTNTPNLTLNPLHHRQEARMDLIEDLRQAFGLPEAANEAAVLAAARAAQAATSAHAQQVAAIAAAAGVQATESTAIITALQAQRQTAGSAEQLHTELMAVRNELTTLANERARERAAAFVDGQIAAGKPVSPAMRDHYVTRHMTDAAAVERELGAMISLHAGGLGGRPVQDQVALHAEDGLTPQEREIAAKMNLDPKQFSQAAKGKFPQAQKKGA